MAVEIDKYDFDPDYFRKIYREERDKRLRQDGNEHYQEVSGEFAYFVEDPYIDDEIDRESVNEDVEVVIIGGVFVMETLSVIIQVSFFRYTKYKYGEGKRFFKMAPIHHHFELSGMKENKIVTRFWIVGILFALLSLATFKIR